MLILMTQSPTPARLNGHDGMLLEQHDQEWLWQGSLSGVGLAALLGAASSGALRIDTGSGGARDVVVQRCWFDVEAGRLWVSLREPRLAA